MSGAIDVAETGTVCETVLSHDGTPWIDSEGLVRKDDGLSRAHPPEGSLSKTTSIPTRRKISARELDLIAAGVPGAVHGVYIGRGTGRVPRSRFANPFKVNVDGTLVQVIELFKEYSSKAHTTEDILSLAGRVLLCHCAVDRPCHADALILRFIEESSRAGVVSRPTSASSYIAPGADQVPSGSWKGWLGEGPPRLASMIGKVRQYQDGGGNCSPGRWPPTKRRFPEWGNSDFMDQAKLIFEEAVKDFSDGSDDCLGLMLKLSAGKVNEPPFKEYHLHEIRTLVWKAFAVPVEMRGVPERQSMRLGTLSRMLQHFHDPDWEFIWGLRDGVPLGYDEDLPRTPCVFDAKVAWKLGKPEEVDTQFCDNYKSAEDYLREIDAQFREEKTSGWMLEMSDDEAHRRFGDRLFVASLGVSEEPGKLRVIHDASHGVHINHRIRVRDQLHFPGAGDLRQLLGELQDRGQRVFALLGDVSQAHRQIKVVERDWGLQACRLQQGRLWINTVGTYGVGSAGYWWGRLAAAVLVRLLYYLIGTRWSPEFLLYADDLFSVASRIAEIIDIGVLIFVLTALGVPLKWGKFRGGFQVTWIGYWIDLHSYRFGISEKRAKWLADWMEECLKSLRVDLRDLQAVLGRLSFAMGPIEHLRPFVSPIYIWSASVGQRGHLHLPWSIAFLFKMLIEIFRGPGRAIEVRPRKIHLGEAFRADAKADGLDVIIGGWETLGSARPEYARWFSIRLTRSSAPWAFSRGEPYRTIAALELFGTLVAIMAFSDRWPKCAKGMIALSGLTDNCGNSYVVSRLMSSRFPLVVILAELACQLQARDLDFALGWIPRDQNQEADALSNEFKGDFNDNNRVDFKLEDASWIVLPRYMQVAEELYRDIQKSKETKEWRNRDTYHRQARGKRLRVREPWED